MNGYDQYRRVQTETAAPEDRVALLYDGARRFVDHAAAALVKNDLSETSKYVGKAQNILTELSASLNLEAGEVAHNLFRLYDYWNWRLSQGQVKRDPEALKEVSAALSDLHGAWVEAAKQIRSQRSVASVG